jgi:hypothetical protein
VTLRPHEALTFTSDETDSLFLITGDVEGLYVNIPQQTALDVIGEALPRIFAKDLEVGADRAAKQRALWVKEAMCIVFTRMYMTFGEDLYKQIYMHSASISLM